MILSKTRRPNQPVLSTPVIKRGDYVVFKHPKLGMCDGKVLFEQSHNQAAVTLFMSRKHDYQIWAPFPKEIRYVNAEAYTNTGY